MGVAKQEEVASLQSASAAADSSSRGIIETLQGEKDGLEKSLGDAQGDLKALEQSQSELERDLEKLQAEHADLVEKQGNTERDLVAKQEEVASLQSASAAADSSSRGIIETLQGEKDGLEK